MVGSVAVGAQGHVVQFYGSEEELTGSAGSFLAGALTADGAAIVVATAAHQRGFQAWLAAAGVDVAAAQSDGTLVALDADDMLRQVLGPDGPDPKRFEAAIGQPIRRATGPGRPVRVFGEMVAVLWASGQVNAALELETLWNHLGGTVPFSLFCAYPMESVAHAGHSDALGEVCRLHAAIVGVPSDVPALPGQPGKRIEATRTFPAARNSPRAARRFVSETLVHWGAVEFIGDAAIVVSELATNAVVHARSGFTVVVSLAGGVLRICVADAAPLRSVHAGPPLAATAGHGLGVIDAMASQWRAEPTDNGKVIWADLRS